MRKSSAHCRTLVRSRRVQARYIRGHLQSHRLRVTYPKLNSVHPGPEKQQAFTGMPVSVLKNL